MSAAQSTITVGLSRHWRNKEIRPGSDYTQAHIHFPPVTLSPADLIAHIQGGNTWTPGIFPDSHRRNESFAGAEVLALDYDDRVSVADLLAIPFVAAHAGLIHPTPSSKPDHRKTRVLFFLSQPLEKVEQFRAFSRAIAFHVGLPVDNASFKAAQKYAGSTNETDDWHIAPDSRLDLRYWAGLMLDDARLDYLNYCTPKAPRIAPAEGDKRAAAYARQTFENILSNLQAAAPGSRNEALYRASFSMACKVAGGWPGFTETDCKAALLSVVETWGNVRKSISTVQSGFRNAPAEYLELSDHAAPAPAPRASAAPVKTAAILPPFTAVRTIDAEFITEAITPADLKGHKTILIKSPTGTGKTEFMRQLVDAMPAESSILAVVHRVSLVDANARRLHISSYRDFKTPDLLASAPHLSITVDSVGRVSQQADIVILDEFDQAMRHLVGAGTLKGRAAGALHALKSQIAGAKLVIALDANATDENARFLSELRGEVYTLKNERRTPRTPVEFVTAVTEAQRRIVEGVKASAGPVVAAIAGRKQARRLHKLLCKLYPGKRGLLITSKNSETDSVSGLLRDINQELPKLAWLIYTSAVSSGLDIQCPVGLVVGIFGQPVRPDDALQMLRRVRHAQAVTVYAPEASGGGETDASAILVSQLEAERLTAHIGKVSPLTHDLRQIASLEAHYRAQTNRMAEAYRDTLIAFLQADGSPCVTRFTAPVKAMSEALKAIEVAEGEALKGMVLDVQTVPTITPDELKQLRIQRVEMTEAHDAGYLRWRIEDVTGQPINADLFDRYQTPTDRMKLARAINLIDTSVGVAEFDRQQAADSIPLHQRRHISAGRVLFMSIVKRVTGAESLDALPGLLQGWKADDLKAHTAFIVQEFSEQLRVVFGYRIDKNASEENGIGVFRWLLSRFGMVLSAKQSRIGNGERCYFYSIDLAAWRILMSDAQAGLAALKAKREKWAASEPVMKRWPAPQFMPARKPSAVVPAQGYKPAPVYAAAPP